MSVENKSNIRLYMVMLLALLAVVVAVFSLNKPMQTSTVQEADFDTESAETLYDLSAIYETCASNVIDQLNTASGKASALEFLKERYGVTDSDLEVFLPENVWKVDQWLAEELGLYNHRTNHLLIPYQSYDISTLEALVAQGDRLAMLTLPNKYLEYVVSSDEFNSIVDPVEKSKLRREISQKIVDVQYLTAIYGLTSSKTGLDVGFTDSAIAMYEISQGINTVENRTEMNRGLAYYEVARRRGDPYAKDSISSTLNESNITLTDSDQDHIQHFADDIYADLEAKRLELGLGEFDNTIPSYVESYF